MFSNKPPVIRTKKFLLAAVLLTSAAPLAHADFYISDSDRIARYANDGTLLNGDFINVDGVTGITIGPEGYLYVATTGGFTPTDPGVYRYDANTGAPVTLANNTVVPYLPGPSTPSSPNLFNAQGLHFGPNGNLYVADPSISSDVHQYDSAGNSIALLGAVSLSSPMAVAFDSNGNLYATSSDSVQKYTGGTTFSTFTQGNALIFARDIAFDSANKLYVLDTSADKMIRYDSDGSNPTTLIDFNTYVTTAGVGGFVASNFALVDDHLYIDGFDLNGDENDGEVLRFDLNGNGDASPFISENDSGIDFAASFIAVTPTVPEPATLLLSTSLLPLFFSRRRRS